MSRQRLTVLGATGSIGVSTLDVVARHPDRFEVFALSGHQRIEVLADQCRSHRPHHAVTGSAETAAELRRRLGDGFVIEIHHGPAALEQVAAASEVDTVMAAIVGAAGLAPTLAAARAGKRILLANKEALVMAGRVFMAEVERAGARLLPIDSEHNAIFQSLPGNFAGHLGRVGVRKILLTASGGPFRDTPLEQLRNVTPEQACAHPNWVMGRKISVDSATMMNKGLEVIEAKHLFGVDPARIEVVIHPQSVVHSMVQYVDSSVLAQLGTPDMCAPIAYGLSWPQRMVSGAAKLDFSQLAALTFESMDAHGHWQRFPCLALAWQAMQAAPGTTAILNAANEVAVDAFLARRIRFDQIYQVSAQTLQDAVVTAPRCLDDLMALDQGARRMAQAVVQHLAL